MRQPSSVPVTFPLAPCYHPQEARPLVAAGETRLMPDSDEALMLRCRDGDAAAFGVLVARHHGPVFRYLLRVTGDREAASDLLQDTFVAAYEAREAYVPSGRFTGWLYTIATNKARNHRRHGTVAGVPADPPRSVEQVAAGGELRGAVREAVLALGDGDREAILLREIAGLSYEELGPALGCTPGAARVRAHRARVRLRELLAPYFGTSGEERP